MRKVEIGIYCCLTADILTKVLQKCSLSSPLLNGLKYVYRIANSVDPDQTAPFGYTVFAQTWLSENLGTLRYLQDLFSLKIVDT